MFVVPAIIKKNAVKGLLYNKKNGYKCNNSIGVNRAKQLITKKKISLVTVKKMYSYLSRAKTYYQSNNLNACGTISFLLWGGIAGLHWSKKIIKQSNT